MCWICEQILTYERFNNNTQWLACGQVGVAHDASTSYLLRIECDFVPQYLFRFWLFLIGAENPVSVKSQRILDFLRPNYPKELCI